ncbi:helix-turn-helix domain-containing protein [Qiania dongpingensis]|uniref:Helix-turn-helix transcriptional regulator n=1 Tax=Qiania dongpingensis TaxID=2763669 RepID=A0A7G9G588_9FIRM|nr:helix-turn-helix transcriptional regulator [Qiania dongpingensis]QNM05970.1 helix-turn-helix transcriptional regulator [Qiania dongpingensis]
MEEKITFGKFVMRKRKEKNLTQKELAERLFVTESAVSKWERGISYPDISLVSSLCEVLEITEHELITSSEDTGQKEMERQAKNFRSLIKTYSIVFYVLYGAGLISCFIVNLAVNHALTWFFIVLAAELLAFSLTVLPVLLKKQNRGVLTFAAFFLSLNLLLFVCCIYTGGNWFGITFISLLFGASVVFLPLFIRDLPLPERAYGHKVLICFAVDTLLLILLVASALIYTGSRSLFFQEGLPAIIIGVAPFWIMMLVIRYTKINGLFKTSICLFLMGIYEFFLNSVMEVVLDHKAFSLPPIRLSDWSFEYQSGNINLVIILAFSGMAVLFAVGGIILSIRKQERKEIG